MFLKKSNHHLTHLTATEESFLVKCKSHDLTFDMSDDHRAYLAGSKTLQDIKLHALIIDPERARLIWNFVVDQKLVEGVRMLYYWEVINEPRNIRKEAHGMRLVH